MVEIESARHRILAGDFCTRISTSLRIQESKCALIEEIATDWKGKQLNQDLFAFFVCKWVYRCVFLHLAGSEHVPALVFEVYAAVFGKNIEPICI